MSLDRAIRFDGFVNQHCEAYEGDFLTSILAIAEGYDILLQGGLLAVTFWYKDVFFLAMTVMILLDTLVNSSLNLIIQQSTPLGSDCSMWMWEMPAKVSELLVMAGTMFTLLSFTRNWKINIHGVGFVVFIVQSTIFYRVYAGINTPEQIYVGAMVGLVLGLCAYWVLWYIVVPGILPMFNNRIFRFENRFFVDYLAELSSRAT